MTCLVDLVRSLDRDRFVPYVLTYLADTGYEETFASLGAEVLCLNRPKPVRKKHNPNTVSPADPRARGHETPQRGLAWRSIKRLLRSDFPIAKSIAGLIEEHGIDLVHHNDNPRGDRASILGARQAGVPQTAHVRYTPLYFPPIDRRLVRPIRRFLPMSRAIEEHLTTNLGPLPAPVEVVYDPFHFDVHDEVLRTSPVDRAEFGFDRDDIVLANIGRITSWKGQDVFLKAMRLVVDRVPRAKALLVGAPNDRDESQQFWKELHDLTDALGLRGSVHFTGFRKDVPSVMAASDIVVHTATMAEPFGKVLVEAMASRRPVVGTAFGGPLEIVTEGETGHLVPASDPEALAQVLIELASHPERITAMGDRGREVAQARYGVEAFTTTLTRVFTEALAS